MWGHAVLYRRGFLLNVIALQLNCMDSNDANRPLTFSSQDPDVGLEVKHPRLILASQEPTSLS